MSKESASPPRNLKSLYSELLDATAEEGRPIYEELLPEVENLWGIESIRDPTLLSTTNNDTDNTSSGSESLSLLPPLLELRELIPNSLETHQQLKEYEDHLREISDLRKRLKAVMSNTETTETVQTPPKDTEERDVSQERGEKGATGNYDPSAPPLSEQGDKVKIPDIPSMKFRDTLRNSLGSRSKERDKNAEGSDPPHATSTPAFEKTRPQTRQQTREYGGSNLLGHSYMDRHRKTLRKQLAKKREQERLEASLQQRLRLKAGRRAKAHTALNEIKPTLSDPPQPLPPILPTPLWAGDPILNRDPFNRSIHNSGNGGGNPGDNPGGGGGDSSSSSSSESERPENMSDASSSNNQRGMASVLTHITKPLVSVWSQAERDDPRRRDRALTHLRMVTQGNVERAIQEDPTIETLDRQQFAMLQMLDRLTSELENIKLESKGRSLSQYEKLRQITINEVYPKEENPSTLYPHALNAFSKSLDQIRIGVNLLESPYDYLLEVCGHSNMVAASYGLTQGQQRLLIMSAIPATHSLSKELTILKDLETIFKFANLQSSSVATRAEIEYRIDHWKLDTSNTRALGESLGELKILLIEAEGLDYTAIDIPYLFSLMIKRIKREPLPPYVRRKLDEFSFDLRTNDDPIDLQNTLQVILRSVGSSKQRPLQVNAIESLSSPNIPIQTLQQPNKSKNGNNKGKEEKAQARNQGQRQNNQGQQNYPPRGRSRSRANNRQNDGRNPSRGRSQSRPRNWRASRSRSRVQSVKQWPQGKPYLSRSGNKVSQELDDWFAGFCHRCGLKGHEASDCKKYPEKITVLTLCETCLSGFHLQCRHPRYANNPQNNMTVNAIRFVGRTKTPPPMITIETSDEEDEQ